MRVVALAEDAPILLGRKRRVVIEMRRRKFNLACQINHMSGTYFWCARLLARSTVSESKFEISNKEPQLPIGNGEVSFFLPVTNCKSRITTHRILPPLPNHGAPR